MAEKSIIIIGAGIAGLAAGCYGRMNGYRTRILEHHSKPGGVATAWTNGPFLIDGGIHYLMGHQPGQVCYEIYRELGIFQNRRYPNLDTFVRFTDEISGKSISITHDLDQVARDLKALAPEDGKVIDLLIAGAQAVRRVDMFKLMEMPQELLGVLTRFRQYWGLRRAFRYLGPEFNQPMRDFSRSVRSEALRRILDHFFLPEVPVWFDLLILGLLANRQLGLLERGCEDFVASLADRYQGLGGEVQYSSTVTEVLVENHRATGVRLADGSVQHADAVVSAGDGRSTIFGLLNGRYVDPKTRQRYENWEGISPIMTISFGVNRTFPGEPPLNFHFLKEPVELGGVTIARFPLRLFNYGAGFAPPGKTVIQVLLEANWDYWLELRKEPARYEREKAQVAAAVLAQLEPHYPGLTGQVELTDIGTPYTTWRYTLNHHGSFMGWMPTPTALRTSVPRTLPGLANFYMAGQWVMPGGGVPPSLYSGRHVIQLLCRRDHKKFTASVP